MKRAAKKSKSGYEGTGDRWCLLLKPCEHIWETGKIPRQMLLTIVVLIPKGTSGKELRGVGLLEVIWKLMERMLDLRLSEIELHDFLHDFRAKRGCGTGIMEATLHQ